MPNISYKTPGFRRAIVLIASLTTIVSGVFGAAAMASTGAHPDAISVVAHRPALPATTPQFSVSLPGIPPGSTFSNANLLNGFGCSGGDLSPAIAWHGAPAATKSYLITLFDEDAPTSSGFWHWVVWNIPAATHSLPEGAGTPGHPGLPPGTVSGITDFGTVLPSGYEGPCPPPGDQAHLYVFSVIALSISDVSALGVPANLPPAALMTIIRDYAIAVGYSAVPLKT